LVGSSDHTIPILFEHNIATVGTGGAIFGHKNSTITTTLQGHFLFHNNIAYRQGGAIYAAYCTVKMQDCHFISNKANIVGGAMSMFHSTVTLNNNDNPNFPMEFRNNEAQTVCHSFSFC
jgi:predicted outer membrane repeat protein